MAKKLTLLAMTVGALIAFAVPAMASASPVLEMPAGTVLGKGTKLTGTSTNAVTKTSLGTLTCEKVSITAILEENTGSKIRAVGSGEGLPSVCKINGTSINITHILVGQLVSTGSTTGTATFSFEADVKTGLTCKYASPTGSPTPVSWKLGTDTIHLAGPLTATPAACGTATFEGDFTLETDPETGTGGVIIS